MRVAIAGGTGLIGRYVVQAARTAGYDVVVLSRLNGVDLVDATGLGEALDGVRAVVDVTNPGSTEQQEPATAFFGAVADNLRRLGAERGVEHVVTLSIVGIDGVPVGYYAAKLDTSAGR